MPEILGPFFRVSMKYSIFTLCFLFSFFSSAMQHQERVEETTLIKTSVGKMVGLPLITRRALAPAYYTVAMKPDETIFEFVKKDWQHAGGFTTMLAQYYARKKGITYLQFLLHSNTNPFLGSKWFIIEVE